MELSNKNSTNNLIDTLVTLISTSMYEIPNPLYHFYTDYILKESDIDILKNFLKNMQSSNIPISQLNFFQDTLINLLVNLRNNIILLNDDKINLSEIVKNYIEQTKINFLEIESYKETIQYRDKVILQEKNKYRNQIKEWADKICDSKKN